MFKIDYLWNTGTEKTELLRTLSNSNSIALILEIPLILTSILFSASRKTKSIALKISAEQEIFYKNFIKVKEKNPIKIMWNILWCVVVQF